MKAIDIINKIATELEESYKSTEDFLGWANSNSDIEVMHESIAYCIDYSITGYRTVKCELTVMKPRIVENKKRWFKTDCEKELKVLIESSFIQILPILYDQRQEEEQEELNEIENSDSDSISMQDTYNYLFEHER